MNNDRELLELAAKAYYGGDVLVEKYNENKNYLLVYAVTSGTRFAPLTDDGDALRLAVKLKITILFEFDRVIACYGYDDEGGFETEFLYDTPVPTDLRAATRRAIVHAAAEIGRAM